MAKLVKLLKTTNLHLHVVRLLNYKFNSSFIFVKSSQFMFWLRLHITIR